MLFLEQWDGAFRIFQNLNVSQGKARTLNRRGVKFYHLSMAYSFSKNFTLPKVTGIGQPLLNYRWRLGGILFLQQNVYACSLWWSFQFLIPSKLIWDSGIHDALNKLHCKSKNNTTVVKCERKYTRWPRRMLPLISHYEYADWRVERQTDGQTHGRQTTALCFPLCTRPGPDQVFQGP